MSNTVATILTSAVQESAYLLNKDLELGLRLGWGLNETSPNFFANTGLGYRY